MVLQAGGCLRKTASGFFASPYAAPAFCLMRSPSFLWLPTWSFAQAFRFSQATFACGAGHRPHVPRRHPAMRQERKGKANERSATAKSPVRQGEDAGGERADARRKTPGKHAAAWHEAGSGRRLGSLRACNRIRGLRIRQAGRRPGPRNCRCDRRRRVLGSRSVCKAAGQTRLNS